MCKKVKKAVGSRSFTVYGNGVFWDVGDCKILDGCDPRRLYTSIKGHLAGLGYRGDISFWAYKETNTIISDELMRRFKDAGIIFKPDVRVKNMLVDILLLANEGRRVNLLVLSENNGAEDSLVASVIQAFRSRKFVTLRGGIELNDPVLHQPVTWVCNWPFTIDQSSERIVETFGRVSFIVTGSGIFWDLMDYPIPTNLDAESVYQTIGTALRDKGHIGDVSIWAYGEMQTLPEDPDPDSRFKIGFVPDGEDYPRGFKMLLDMLFWALDNFKEHNDEFPTLFLLSNDISQEMDFARVVQALENKYYYDVRVSEPDKVPSGVLLSSDSSKWLWTCLLDKGNLIDQGDQEGTNTTVSADDDQVGTNTTVSAGDLEGINTTVSAGDLEGTNTTVTAGDQEGTNTTVSADDDQVGTNTTVSAGDLEGTNTTVSADDDQVGTNTTVSAGDLEGINTTVSADDDQVGANPTVSSDVQEGTKTTVSADVQEGTQTTVSAGDLEGTKTTVSAGDSEGTNTTASGRMKFGGSGESSRVDTVQGDLEGTNTSPNGRMRFGESSTADTDSAAKRRRM